MRERRGGGGGGGDFERERAVLGTISQRQACGGTGLASRRPEKERKRERGREGKRESLLGNNVHALVPLFECVIETSSPAASLCTSERESYQENRVPACERLRVFGQ